MLILKNKNMINTRIISNMLLLSLFLIIGCKQNNPSNNNKNLSDVESRGFKGNVKSYNSKSYEVKNYKFGEPQFRLNSSEITNYNRYGFITEHESKNESKYLNDYFKESLKYSNPELGIILNRKYESTDYYYNKEGDRNYYSQSFVYDTISNKILERKTIKVKDNTSSLKIYRYNENEVRISNYNNITNELVYLTIQKLDNKGDLISSIDYDNKGNEELEKYVLKLKNGLIKDSTIVRYLDKEIMYIDVSTKDDLGREIKCKSIRNKSVLDSFEGYIIEYDNSDINSSFTKKEFKRNENLIFKNIRVNNKYDDNGNVIEVQRLNLDNNKLEEKTVNEFVYYD